MAMATCHPLANHFLVRGVHVERDRAAKNISAGFLEPFPERSSHFLRDPQAE